VIEFDCVLCAHLAACVEDVPQLEVLHGLRQVVDDQLRPVLSVDDDLNKKEFFKCGRKSTVDAGNALSFRYKLKVAYFIEYSVHTSLVHASILEPF